MWLGANILEMINGQVYKGNYIKYRKEIICQEKSYPSKICFLIFVHFFNSFLYKHGWLDHNKKSLHSILFKIFWNF